ncbi:TPA: GDSL-type esterase/lipase family protein, partial [Neisseria gonorrhoeae]
RKPKLVIVGIGGNDFLRKVPEEQTRANIAKIIETVQKENIPAVLVGVPHITLGALFGHLSDHPLYEDLSEEYGIPLFGGAWAEILGNNNLKSDQIHANGKGYRKFAENLNQFLRKHGFR